MAILYLLLAALLIRIFGIELTQYASTLMLAAGVMLGGTYALVMFIWLITHIVHRIATKQPIMEIED